MGFECTLPLMEHEGDKSESETSQVVGCKSPVTKEVKSEEPSLLVRLENKGDTQSVGIVYDPEFNKDGVAKAVTPRADVLELANSSETLDGNFSFGCETPRESIYDPFAPGPDEVACAPKKKAELSRRQLNFESGDYPIKRLSFGSDDVEEEDQYLVVLENLILDLVMPDGFLDRQETIETTAIDWSPGDICKTPDSEPLLTGIATTCPDAPIRPSHKALKLSPSICRKIDFGSV